jgi:hypothetical protein
MHVSCHSTMKRGADRLRHGATAAGDAGLPASINREQKAAVPTATSGSGPRRSDDGMRMPAAVAV